MNTTDIAVSSREQATIRTQRIRQGLLDLQQLVIEISAAWRDRIWLDMGYDTWEPWANNEGLLGLIRSGDIDTIVALHQGGLPQSAVGNLTGTSRHTVHRQLAHAEQVDAAALARTVAGRDGRKRPSKRAKPDELERRRDHVVRLWLAGYAREPIAAALGISHGSISEDLTARGVTRTRSRVNTRSDSIEPIDWRNGATNPSEIIPPPPSYTPLSDAELANVHPITGRSLQPKTPPRRRARRVDSTLVIEKRVELLYGLELLLDEVDYDELPPERVSGWIADLTAALRTLNKLRTRLKETIQP